MPLITRFRERLVLGHVRHSLDDGERIVAWAHARVPDVRAPGVIVVTERRCLLHVASRNVDDRVSPWAALRGWRLEHLARSRVQLVLSGDAGDAVSELWLTSRGRARSASRVVAAIAGQAADTPFGDPVPGVPRRSPPPQLYAAPRGVRDHARRVAVTVLGVAVLLLSVVFASPFVPGPGALTAVAGIAILAREYEWARDLHVWASRQLDRFLAWLRRRKDAVTNRRHPVVDEAEPTPPLREAA